MDINVNIIIDMYMGIDMGMGMYINMEYLTAKLMPYLCKTMETSIV
jgi:hypothetical protein